jgi:hypothetical protein
MGLAGKPEEKRPMGRPSRRWEDNIKMDVQEVGCGGMDWIKLTRVRDRWWVLVNAVMQRFSNCGQRTTSGPRVLLLWSS